MQRRGGKKGLFKRNNESSLGWKERKKDKKNNIKNNWLGRKKNKERNNKDSKRSKGGGRRWKGLQMRLIIGGWSPTLWIRLQITHVYSRTL
jgi:hypothetical protein